MKNKQHKPHSKYAKRTPKGDRQRGNGDNIAQPLKCKAVFQCCAQPDLEGGENDTDIGECSEKPTESSLEKGSVSFWKVHMAPSKGHLSEEQIPKHGEGVQSREAELAKLIPAVDVRHCLQVNTANYLRHECCPRQVVKASGQERCLPSNGKVAAMLYEPGISQQKASSAGMKRWVTQVPLPE